MYTRIALIILMVFAGLEADAQFWKKKKNTGESTQAPSHHPNSLDPSYQRQEKKTMHAPSARATRTSSKGRRYTPEQEFYERMEEVAKMRRKVERIMEKPQYSDPSYFGHKRPPKKRKPSKMKFCKECGIRH